MGFVFERFALTAVIAFSGKNALGDMHAADVGRFGFAAHQNNLLACRHALLSTIFPQAQSDPAHPFTVRMLVPNAIMIVSAGVMA